MSARAHGTHGVDNVPGVVRELGCRVARGAQEGGGRSVRTTDAAVVDDDGGELARGGEHC